MLTFGKEIKRTNKRIVCMLMQTWTHKERMSGLHEMKDRERERERK